MVLGELVKGTEVEDTTKDTGVILEKDTGL